MNVVGVGERTLTADLALRPASIVLVGAAHVDQIAISDAPFHPGYSNPGRVIERVGGAAFNAAKALRVFGHETALVSACGGDEAAERIGAEFDRLGISDARIAWLDRRSATYTALVDVGGDLVGGVADMEIYDRLNPRVLSRRHVLDRVANADGLIVDANLSSAALAHLAALKPASLAAIAVSPAKIVRLAPVLRSLSVLFASLIEIAALLELPTEASDGELVAAVRTAGLARAVVTDGARPILVVEPASSWRQAPPTVDAVVDVVGAGDTLAGTAFGAWLGGFAFTDAVRLGLAAASLRIGSGLDEASARQARAIAAALPNPDFILT